MAGWLGGEVEASDEEETSSSRVDLGRRLLRGNSCELEMVQMQLDDSHRCAIKMNASWESNLENAAVSRNTRKCSDWNAKVLLNLEAKLIG